MIKINCYRITKYNPKYRDEKDNYKKNEWTSIHDIDKKFNGIKFTFFSYLIYENAYVDAIVKIMFSNSSRNIILKELEIYNYVNYLDFDSVEVKKIIKSLKNNLSISIINVKIIIKLILREIIWCKLENKSMYVHFGYDYNMYVGSKKPLINEM